MTDTTMPSELPQLLRDAMRDLEGRVRAWWKRDGLGHLFEVHLTRSGMLEVELSCSLYMEVMERMYDEDQSLPEPERRARVLKQYEARGFVTVAEPGGDPGVKDCDASRTTLQQLVKGVFPSAVVRAVEVRGTRSGAFVLSKVTVLIRDLAEVLALPAPEPGSD